LDISGFVTRCHPPESLAFAWTDAKTISRVLFEIERRPSHVLFLLTHAGLPMGQTSKCSASWHAHLDILQARLDNKQAEPYATTFRRVISLYEKQRDVRTWGAEAL
jgi:hypothetical protein